MSAPFNRDRSSGNGRRRSTNCWKTNAAKPAREQLTLIRIFEELRGRGYGGGYDAVRRYARRWAKERGESTAAAYVPLSFAPGEAFQFNSHGLLEVKVFRRHMAEPLGYWS